MDSGPVSGTGQAFRRNDDDLTDTLPAVARACLFAGFRGRGWIQGQVPEVLPEGRPDVRAFERELHFG